MIFGKTKLELKVGAFVFSALLLLVVSVLSIGNFKSWTSGYRVSFLFNFVNGIKLGAPVRFAGVDVGEVKAITFAHPAQSAETRINLDCWVRKDIKIPLDSTIWVNTLGLLGEKYVEIMPGSDYGKCLAENQSLKGEDPLPMHEMGTLVKRIAENVDDAVTRVKNKKGTLGRLLYDDALYEELQAAIRNKDGTVGRLFYDDTLYTEMQSLIQDLRAHPWKLFWKTKEKKSEK